MTTWQRCITSVTKHFFSLIAHTAAADDDDEENPGGDSEDEDNSMSGICVLGKEGGGIVLCFKCTLRCSYMLCLYICTLSGFSILSIE